MAIKHPQIDIFELVVKKEMLARRLIYNKDRQCGEKKKTGYAAEKIQSPAPQLQKELLLFEVDFHILLIHYLRHFFVYKSISI